MGGLNAMGLYFFMLTILIVIGFGVIPYLYERWKKSRHGHSH